MQITKNIILALVAVTAMLIFASDAAVEMLPIQLLAGGVLIAIVAIKARKELA